MARGIAGAARNGHSVCRAAARDRRTAHQDLCRAPRPRRRRPRGLPALARVAAQSCSGVAPCFCPCSPPISQAAALAAPCATDKSRTCFACMTCPCLFFRSTMGLGIFFTRRSTAAEAKRGVRVLRGSALDSTSFQTPSCPPPSLGLAPCALMRAVTLSHTRSHTQTRATKFVARVNATTPPSSLSVCSKIQ